MNKVFLDLLPDEWPVVEVALGETEQIHWVLEKGDNRCQLCGYFEDDFQKSWESLRQQIPLLSGKTLVCSILRDCDWKNEYKKFLTPFNIGPLHVVPVWERESYGIPEKHFGIYLDAEMAFGTGAHETTKLCLARIVDYWNLFRNSVFLRRVIDVGCGSGILSLGAAKLGFGNVYGFDVDPDAIAISEKNARNNEIHSIEFKVADISEGILGRQADLIVANILAPTLISQAPILVNTIRQYGILSLSGILVEELESVKNVFMPLVERYWDCGISNTKTMGQWAEIAYVRT
ncbi:MAG: 50S ribosomal protein L11 methyltransferase [Puniceicoccales bacterium]|jgi:ribosomal protein L11 methyltransferase|nr:50S ribosomal protein L11 methyltransferase [Puniceicoccales bacterium]